MSAESQVTVTRRARPLTPAETAPLSPDSAVRLRRLRHAALRALARMRGDEDPTEEDCDRAVWDGGLAVAYHGIARARVHVAAPAAGADAAGAAMDKRAAAGGQAVVRATHPLRPFPLGWAAAVGGASFASRLVLGSWSSYWDGRAHLPTSVPMATGSFWSDLPVHAERIRLAALAGLGDSAGMALSLAAVSSVALVSAVAFLLVYARLHATPASRRSALVVAAALVLLVGASLNLWSPSLIPSGLGVVAFAALSPITLLLVRSASFTPPARPTPAVAGR